MTKDIILCDLDGTLADIAHRRHFVEHPARQCPDCQGRNRSNCVNCSDNGWDKFKLDWPAFHKACVDDTPLQTTIDLVSALARPAGLHLDACELWVVSGRSDEVQDETETWLRCNGIYFDRLIMRKQGDYTPDDVLKKSWLDSGLIPKDRVFCVFDDRDRVVQMWRNEGLICYQVAPGDF